MLGGDSREGGDETTCRAVIRPTARAPAQGPAAPKFLGPGIVVEGRIAQQRGTRADSQDAGDDDDRESAEHSAYSDWEITACMSTDVYFTSLLLGLVVLGTPHYRRLEMTYAGAIFTVLAAALVTHLFVMRVRAGFYRRHRTRALVAMRLLVPVCVLGAWLTTQPRPRYLPGQVGPDRYCSPPRHVGGWHFITSRNKALKRVSMKRRAILSGPTSM